MDVADTIVIGDLVARDRRSDAPALRAQALGRRYDYHRLCTDAWRTAHLLSHRGVHGATRGGATDQSTVAVADDPVPETVLAFLGAALLGARTLFVAVGSGNDPGDSDCGDPRDSDCGELAVRAFVVPVDLVDEYELPPGAQRIGYGGPTDDPTVVQFERDVWRENPAEPPDRVAPKRAALSTDDGDRSHADLLATARRIAENWRLGPADSVAVRTSLERPGTVVAGVVAPLLAGGTILFPAASDGVVGDVAVAENPETVPEERAIPVGEVV